ncbi:hypothetical protein HZC53_00275 [Candidatus Uhrbacteria bacterium]|nr:hypothetical protein [Candidatus Uhrbacteria bacterium]
MPEDRPHFDSLRPVETPVLPVTLPPKPIQKRHKRIICTIAVIGAGILANAFICWLLLYPILGENQLLGALLAVSTLVTQIASFVAHVLIFNEVRARRR